MPHSPISILFNFSLRVFAEIFHTVNIDVPAGVGAPLLNTQLFYLTKSAIWSRPAMPLAYCYYGKAHTITSIICYVPQMHSWAFIYFRTP